MTKKIIHSDREEIIETPIEDVSQPVKKNNNLMWSLLAIIIVLIIIGLVYYINLQKSKNNEHN